MDIGRPFVFLEREDLHPGGVSLLGMRDFSVSDARRVEAICEALHDSFHWNAAAEAWHVPTPDLQGVRAWLQSEDVLGIEDESPSVAESVGTRHAGTRDCVRVLIRGGRLKIVPPPESIGDVSNLRAGCLMWSNEAGLTDSSRAEWDYHAGTADPKHKLHSMVTLAGRIQDALVGIRELNRSGSDWRRNCLQKLVDISALGGQLFAEVTSDEDAFRRLVKSFEQNVHVSIESPDVVDTGDYAGLRTRDLPFHLMCTDKGGLAADSAQAIDTRNALSERALGLRFALGISDHETIDVEPPREDRRGVVFLLGDWMDREDRIGDELDAVGMSFEHHGWTVEYVKTVDQYRGFLKEARYPDIIHVAGHNASGAVRLAGRPLGGNDVLNAQHLDDLLFQQAQHPPRLVFLNTCSGARVITDSPKGVSLADVVLKHAATCCIATMADLDADPDGRERAGMSHFAEDFYQELLLRERPFTVGEALRLARVKDHENWGLVWTKYVLLGNPMTRIIAGPSPAPTFED